MVHSCKRVVASCVWQTVRRPHFRQLKPYQQIIRENYRGAPEGRYTGALAFFSESDKAFSELKRCLKRPPADNKAKVGPLRTR
eukprot:40491-Eustigmatos_ZCMA.PRE.1